MYYSHRGTLRNRSLTLFHEMDMDISLEQLQRCGTSVFEVFDDYILLMYDATSMGT